MYLILELLLGGELLDAVMAKGSYCEADARLCFVQLLRGIHYLHSRSAVIDIAVYPGCKREGFRLDPTPWYGLSQHARIQI